MYANGRGYFVCRVRKQENERNRYRRNMLTAEGKAKLNAKSRAQADRRKTDPVYRLDRQLWDMTRVRIRY